MLLGRTPTWTRSAQGAPCRGDTPGVAAIEEAHKPEWHHHAGTQDSCWRGTVAFSTTEPRMLLAGKRAWPQAHPQDRLTAIFCENGRRDGDPSGSIARGTPASGAALALADALQT